MKIITTSKHFDLTEAIRLYTEEKIATALPESLKISSVRTTMDLEKNRFRTDIQILAKHHDFSANAEDFDLYKSFDAALAKAVAQVVKLIDKVQDHQHTPLRDATAAPEAPAQQ